LDLSPCWPVGARSHAKDESGRRQLAHRFAQDCLRMSMYDGLRPEHFPVIAERLKAPVATTKPKKPAARD
jgi:hypothetical protein